MEIILSHANRLMVSLSHSQPTKIHLGNYIRRAGIILLMETFDIYYTTLQCNENVVITLKTLCIAVSRLLYV